MAPLTLNVLTDVKDMKPFLENKSYIGVNLLDFENNPTPRAVKLWGDVAKLIAQGSLTPVKPIQQFTFGEVEKAFRYMQTGMVNRT